MSKVLFNRKPITIDIDFATAVGLNEAIVLQQIHYWIVKNKEEKLLKIFSMNRAKKIKERKGKKKII